MNLKKTKVMYYEFAENVEEPNTESNKIDEGTSKEQEIKRRITLGLQAFSRASAIFKNKDLPQSAHLTNSHLPDLRI